MDPGNGIATAPVLDKDLAAQELILTVQEVRKAEGDKTVAYAQIILACGKCEDAGFNRSQIAKMIAQAWGSEKESKGLAARYVILSRLHRKQFTKGEIPVLSIVVKEIEHTMTGDAVTEVHVEKEYSSPVDMLMSGKHTFTGVYNAWKAAVKPPKSEEDMLPETLVEAADRAMNRLKLIAKTDPDGVKVVDDIKAWKAVMLTMLGQPMAGSVFGKSLVKSLAKKVGMAFTGEDEENPKETPGEVGQATKAA